MSIILNFSPISPFFFRQAYPNIICIQWNLPFKVLSQSINPFNLSHQILSRHAALVYFNGFWILFYSWYWYFVSSLSFFLISLVSILSILSLIIFSSGFLIICIYILSFANFCSFIILLDLIGSYFPAFLAEPPKTD